MSRGPDDQSVQALPSCELPAVEGLIPRMVDVMYPKTAVFLGGANKLFEESKGSGNCSGAAGGIREMVTAVADVVDRLTEDVLDVTGAKSTADLLQTQACAQALYGAEVSYTGGAAFDCSLGCAHEDVNSSSYGNLDLNAGLGSTIKYPQGCATSVTASSCRTEGCNATVGTAGVEGLQCRNDAAVLEQSLIAAFADTLANPPGIPADSAVGQALATLQALGGSVGDLQLDPEAAAVWPVLTFNVFANLTNDQVYQLIASAAGQGELVDCPVSSNACGAVRVVNPAGEAVVVGTGCAAEPVCPTTDGTFATGNWSDLFLERPDIALTRSNVSALLAAEKDDLYGVVGAFASCFDKGLATKLTDFDPCISSVKALESSAVDRAQSSVNIDTSFSGIDLGEDQSLSDTLRELETELQTSGLCSFLSSDVQSALGPICAGGLVNLTLGDIFNMISDLVDPVLCKPLGELLVDGSSGSFIQVPIYNIDLESLGIDAAAGLGSLVQCGGTTGVACSLQTILGAVPNILLSYGQPLLTDGNGKPTGSLLTLASKLATYEAVFGPLPATKTAPVAAGSSFATACCTPGAGETTCEFVTAEVASSNVALTNLEKTYAESTSATVSGARVSSAAAGGATAAAAVALAAAALLMAA